MAHQHIVLDLETLGTEPGCPILSIGACAFDLDYDNFRVFYRKIHLAYQPTDKISVDTLSWWMEQDRAAQAAAWIKGEDAENYYAALQLFGIWVDSIKKITGGAGITIWGNSSSFDNEILRAAYKHCGVEAPWTFREDRDFRTLRALYKEKVPEPEFIGIRHHAKYDAMHEAKWLKLILQRMKAEESAWRCQENARQESAYAALITSA